MLSRNFRSLIQFSHFFEKKSSHRSRHSFFAFEVPNRKFNLADSKWRGWPLKRKLRPKKNEYFDYLGKATAKKKDSFKKFSNQEKKYLDHPRDLESGQSNPSPSPPPLCRVKILSSPGPMSQLTIAIVKGVYSLAAAKNLQNNTNSPWPTDSTLQFTLILLVDFFAICSRPGAHNPNHDQIMKLVITRKKHKETVRQTDRA